jgi:hypothetical protein
MIAKKELALTPRLEKLNNSFYNIVGTFISHFLGSMPYVLLPLESNVWIV